MMIGGMTKHWITAAKALAIVAEHSSPTSAQIGLCSRAHADLVETKAKLVTVGGRGHEDSPVPADFWWADGGAALDQDWAVGDFSTWLNRKVECKAFGVLFDLEGVLAMIPAQRRGRSQAQPLGGQAIRPWAYGAPGGDNASASSAWPGRWEGEERALIDNCRLRTSCQLRAVLMQRCRRRGEPGEWSPRRTGVGCSCLVLVQLHRFGSARRLE